MNPTREAILKCLEDINEPERVGFLLYTARKLLPTYFGKCRKKELIDQDIGKVVTLLCDLHMELGYHIDDRIKDLKKANNIYREDYLSQVEHIARLERKIQELQKG